jgi:transcriptional regulator with PAS, ATPase and Fis domain
MIGVIAPYSQFKKDIEDISKSINIQVVVEVGALETGLSKAKEMILKHDVKIIIARGVTADFLKKKLDIPIIKIDVTNFDMIKTIAEAKKIDRTVFLFDHIENQGRLDLETIKGILNVDINLKYFTNEREITKQIIEMAKVHERGVMVGTAECMANTAGKKGIQPFIIFSQTDSITEALLRAEESLQNFAREEVKKKHLESIISYAFDGVISTDTNGIVTVCNDVAAKHLGILCSEIIGRNTMNIHIPLFKKLVWDQTDTSKKVITNCNIKYVLNRVSLGGKSLVITFQEAEVILQMDTKVRSELYSRRFFAKYTFDDIVYQSTAIEQIISLAKVYAKSDSSVLINGESGTGKELIAQSIHSDSTRNNGPFIAINCAALPENLLESELFGYVDGAFTGAQKGGKSGLFEMAHGGTIFLDEIGEIAITLQTRLLRVLQEKEVRRIGGDRIIPVDVRVVSATNKDLLQCIQRKEFRSDLYYRLNILHIQLPALRDRKGDLDLLIDRFLLNRNEKPVLISEQSRKILRSYKWPGNIRELENFIERVVVVGPQLHDQLISDLQLQSSLYSQQVNESDKEYVKVKVGRIEEMENQIFNELILSYDGNKSELADKLGISRTTLWKKMKQAH